MADDLFERLKNAKRLPSPPGVALRVLHLAQQEDASLGEITAAISSDPALAAKILKFVNSPIAGVARSISSLHQAISMIGLRAVKLMALSFSLVSTGRKGVCAGFDFDGFWSRSLACAVACRTIARTSETYAPEEAFVSGLLSEIGQLVLASGVPDLYAEVLAQAKDSPEPLWEVERSRIGVTHMEFGRALLAHWQLPEGLCKAIAEFRDMGPEVDREAFGPLTRILYTASLAAAIICGAGGRRGREIREVADGARNLFGWDGPVWERVFGKITQDWQEYGRILSIKTSEVGSFAEIQLEAQECIAELSLATQIEARQVEEELGAALKRASTDGLTGLGNRAAFDERLEHEVNRAVRTKRPLALVMMDVDRFKRFNDTHGHQAGDAVLRMVAQTAKSCVRQIDFAARYGGEELAVIAPECEPAGAVQLGERLRRGIAAAHLSYRGQTLKVTVSVGVVVYATADGSRCPADLIRAADRLLYRAKDAGRNCVMSAAFRPAASAGQVAASPRAPSEM